MHLTLYKLWFFSQSMICAQPIDPKSSGCLGDSGGDDIFLIELWNFNYNNYMKVLVLVTHAWLKVNPRILK
jgi:hypothetical protein